MNRQQAKELLPIIQAFAEGKTIQFLGLTETEEWWKDLQCDKDIQFNYHFSRYRIKPEPKYRLFANREECWQEMLKHQPFGWIKEDKDNCNIIFVGKYGIAVNCGIGNGYYDFKKAFNLLTFDDGTPFGIKE